MKITKIRIKNLFGIKELELDGKDREFVGDNGTGKTSVIDAIRLALNNKSSREYVIRTGESDAEVIIETDTGIMVKRLFRTQKADYASIKQEGEKGQKTEAFLRDLFTELQINPVEFINMPSKEQNRIILDMIDFKWDLNWIREQFGEIVPEVNYEQNILGVLNEIQAEGGYYFQMRQDINREIKSHINNVEEIGKDLPDGYDAKKWREIDLSQRYKTIEEIRHYNQKIQKAKDLLENRDSKKRGLDQAREIEKSSVQKAHKDEQTELEKKIIEAQNIISESLEKIRNNDDRLRSKFEIIDKTYEANLSKLEGELEEYEPLAKEELKDFSELQKEADQILKMKEHANEYDRMVRLQKEADSLKIKSDILTQKIEKARTLPGEILQRSKIPIKGITVKDGIPLINGLPISNLSEGEKLALCIDVAANNPESLRIMLIDGVERLSEKNRSILYQKLKDKKIQFMATRTTDSPDLTVVEL